METSTVDCVCVCDVWLWFLCFCSHLWPEEASLMTELSLVRAEPGSERSLFPKAGIHLLQVETQRPWI